MFVNTPTFFYNLFSAEGRTARGTDSERNGLRKGQTLWIEFHNFGTKLQVRCKSTEDLPNF